MVLRIFSFSDFLPKNAGPLKNLEKNLEQQEEIKKLDESSILSSFLFLLSIGLFEGVPENIPCPFDALRISMGVHSQGGCDI